jgi:hypothetical protein
MVGVWLVCRRGGGIVSVVVTPSACESFTPCELTAAYKDFKERGPQYLNAETGLRAAAYQFGTHVLIVYQESETGVVVLTRQTSLKRLSQKVGLTHPGEFHLPLRTDTSALREPISQKPGGLPVLTSQSVLREHHRPTSSPPPLHPPPPAGTSHEAHARYPILFRSYREGVWPE